MSCPWHESLKQVRRWSVELLSSNEPFPPDFEGQSWDEVSKVFQNEDSAISRTSFFLLLKQSSKLKLAHKICHDISDLRMIVGRPFEDWEFKLINAMVPMFQVEWNAWRKTMMGRSGSSAYHGYMRVSLSNLMRYFELWTPRECKELSPKVINALHDLEQICQSDSTEKLLVGVPLESFLAKVAGGGSSYVKQLSPVAAPPIIARLRDASDAQEACKCLFEIAATCQHSNGLRSMIQSGAPEEINAFLIRFASDPEPFKSLLPICVQMTATTESSCVPQALRKCLISLASSERSVKALAGAGILQGIASVAELYERTDIIQQMQFGLSTMYSGPDEFFLSVCLSVACVAFPYAPEFEKEIGSRIVLAANEIAFWSEDSFASNDTKKYATALTLQVAMHTQGSRSSTKASKCISDKIARQTIQSLYDRLPKSCSGPNCQHDEEPGTKFQICAGCKIACYCSKKCQKAHWKAGHKTECVKLADGDVASKIAQIQKDLNSRTSCASDSARSDVSIMSWVSSAVHTTSGCCFPPNTAFNRPGGEWVRAAELRHDGGDVLVGPGGSHVEVLKVETHSPQRREFVKLRTTLGTMVVTSDHSLRVEDIATGRPIDIPAKRFKKWESWRHGASASSEQAVGPPRVFDGENFQTVHEITIYKKEQCVVAITFKHESDAVLAWTFPGRRPRKVLPGSSTACLGRPHFASFLMDRLGLEVKNSFIAEPSSQETINDATGRVRSNSEGAKANSQSRWSAHTGRHEDGACRICWEHHRHLINPKRAPCKNGAGCNMCHAEHGWQGQRPANRTRGPR